MIERRDENDPRWKATRYAALVRDGFTCNLCNTKGGKLNGHHILKWSEYPKLRYVLNNVITLCEKCHNNQVTGNEDKYVEQFQKIIAQKKLMDVNNAKHRKKSIVNENRMKAMNKWRATNPRLRN